MFNATKGICENMCPPKERLFREKQRLLHQFEIQLGSEKNNFPKADHKLCIKAYVRSNYHIELNNPDDLRTPNTLLQTINHLTDNIMPRKDCSWLKVYNFIFDRMRAVRQDLIIQQIKGTICAQIFEKMIQFYIFSSYKLCTEKSLSLYDPYLNERHCSECFTSLLLNYKNSVGDYPNRAEFECLFILFNLGSSECLNHVLNLEKHIRSFPSVKLAILLNNSYLECNYVRFFKLLSKFNFLQLCATHKYFDITRKKALSILDTAYSTKNSKYPISHLTKILRYNSEDELKQMCNTLRLKIKDNNILFYKGNFCDKNIERRYSILIDEKLKHHCFKNCW